MCRLSYVVIFSLFISLNNIQISVCQRHIKASDKITPQWIHRPPKAASDLLSYVPVTICSNSLEASTALSLNELSQSLPRNWNISNSVLTVDEGIISRNSNTGEITSSQQSQSYELQVLSEGMPVSLRCQEVDRYWRLINLKGKTVYQHSILYQVASPNSNYPFESTYTTTSYGARGMWRSMLVPGWGQFYKGDNLKGGLILGSTAVMVAGIVFTENQRSGYSRRIMQTYDINLIRSYQTKRDNFATTRNICMGATATLYLYNIIDAIVARGARRIVVKHRTNKRSYSFLPSMVEGGTPAMTAAITL